MKQGSDVAIEYIITARMRRDDPDIERVGVRREEQGWCCHWVWVMNDAPRLTATERGAILYKANLILAELCKDYEKVSVRGPLPETRTLKRKGGSLT
ncbi:MAG: hypothetical protein JO105_16640 [Hyphomicrobiales bacterium]|nr:hypothetical protein [Hyphomicrobiales bacterium]